MISLYLQANKNFLFKVLILWAHLIMASLLSRFFNIPGQDLLLYSLLGSGALILVSLVFIPSFNNHLYSKNLEWIVHMPYSRRKLCLFHFFFVCIQLLETFLLAPLFFLISFALLPLKSEEFAELQGPVVQFLDLTGLEVGQNLWGTAYHFSTTLIIIGFSSYAIFTIRTEKGRFKEYWHSITKGNKRLMTIFQISMIFIGVTIWGVRVHIPPVIVNPILLCVTIALAVINYHGVFRLKYPDPKKVIQNILGGSLVMGAALGSFSVISLRTTSNLKSIINDMTFLGKISKNYSLDAIKRSFKKGEYEAEDLNELARVLGRKRWEWSLKDFVEFPISFVVDHDDPDKISSLIKMLPQENLSWEELVLLVRKFESINHNDFYVYLQNQFITLKKLPSKDGLDLFIKEGGHLSRRILLDLALVFPKDKRILEVIKNNYRLYKSNEWPMLLSKISFLYLEDPRLIGMGISWENKERNPASINFDEKKCKRLSHSKLSNLSNKDLGILSKCINHFVAKENKNFIVKWPKHPLSVVFQLAVERGKAQLAKRLKGN